MKLDIATLHVVLSIALAFMTGAIWFLRRLHSSHNAFSFWAIADLSSAIGIFLVVLQRNTENIWTVAFPNFLVSFGILSFWIGTRAFYNMKLPWLKSVLILSIFTAIEVYYYEIEPLTWVRVANESILIGVVSVLTIMDLYPIHKEGRFKATKFAIMSHLMHGTTFFIRGIYCLIFHPTALYIGLDSLVLALAAVEGLLAVFFINICFLLLGSEQLQLTLDRLATIDDLTGLYNRRAFNKYTQDQIARTTFSKKSTLLLLDLDNFKMINDRYGHQAGDTMLRELGALLRRNVRAGDIVGRLGGEEFSIFLPSISPVDAFHIAERIRILFSQTEVSFNGRTIATTLSIGMAAVSSTDTLEKALQRSDEALYSAKNLGKNRISSAPFIETISLLPSPV